jgi:hypothetical protein
MVRPLVISAMAAALAACSYLAPQQEQQATLTGSARPPVLPDHQVARTKKDIGAKGQNSRHRRISAHVKTVKSDLTTASTIAKRHPDNKGPMIKKAETTITAKLNYPIPVKFTKMKWAIGKDALGNSIDTICGYVTGKELGVWRFLYLVQKDKAYIGSHNIANTPYRNACT